MLNIKVQPVYGSYRLARVLVGRGGRDTVMKSAIFASLPRWSYIFPLKYLLLLLVRCCRGLDKTCLSMLHSSCISSTSEVWKKTVQWKSFDQYLNIFHELYSWISVLAWKHKQNDRTRMNSENQSETMGDHCQVTGAPNAFLSWASTCCHVIAFSLFSLSLRSIFMILSEKSEIIPEQAKGQRGWRKRFGNRQPLSKEYSRSWKKSKQTEGLRNS